MMDSMLYYDGVVHYCYLLQSMSNSRKWYVGYTQSPVHRLSQHNGEHVGGAKETSKDRPWRLVCCISGMPNQQQGLIWEWAWQNRKLANKPKGNKTPRYIHRLIQLLSLNKVTDKAYSIDSLSLFLYIDPQYHTLFQSLPITVRNPFWVDF